MSCCNAEYVKRLDPLTGTITVYDLATGAVVTDAAVLATLVPCPKRETISEEVCIQETGNTDPNLVVPGKCLQVLDVAHDGAVTVLSTTLLDLAGTDVSDTHEVTRCPDMTPIDVGLCAPPA